MLKKYFFAHVQFKSHSIPAALLKKVGGGGGGEGKKKKLTMYILCGSFLPQNAVSAFQLG